MKFILVYNQNAHRIFATLLRKHIVRHVTNFLVCRVHEHQSNHELLVQSETLGHAGSSNSWIGKMGNREPDHPSLLREQSATDIIFSYFFRMFFIDVVGTELKLCC